MTAGHWCWKSSSLKPRGRSGEWCPCTAETQGTKPRGRENENMSAVMPPGGTGAKTTHGTGERHPRLPLTPSLSTPLPHCSCLPLASPEPLKSRQSISLAFPHNLQHQFVFGSMQREGTTWLCSRAIAGQFISEKAFPSLHFHFQSWG